MTKALCLLNSVLVHIHFGVGKYAAGWQVCRLNMWEVKAAQNMGDSFDRQMTLCVPKGGYRVLLTFNKMFHNVANSIQ